jgi:hypothetical protein
MGEIKWHNIHVRAYNLFYNVMLIASVSFQVNEQRVDPISRPTFFSISWFMRYYKRQFKFHILYIMGWDGM